MFSSALIRGTRRGFSCTFNRDSLFRLCCLVEHVPTIASCPTTTSYFWSFTPDKCIYQRTYRTPSHLSGRSNIFGSHDILGSWLPARYISNESVELKTHNDVIRFSLGKSDDINNAKKSQLNKKFKISRKAKLNELKCYRLKAKKKMNSPNPEVRIRYKLEKAKRKETWLIEKLQKFDVPKPPPETYDPEILTEEERHYMKRTVGRRGVFGGVVLNMHLHWKNHETVKVICKPCKPGQVHEYAEELARLSKGIVIDIKPNNTIIFYRGKNYVKPEVMSPPNTLSKAKNSPDELYLLFQQFCDHFHATSRNSMYMNFISSHSNNIHALEQLRSIKDKASSSAQKKITELMDDIRENVSVLTLLAEVLCLLDMIVNSFAHMISTKPVDRYTRPEFTENGPLAIYSKQAINHIKRKYELENMEIVNKEKEKVRYDFLVDKAIAEIEAKCGQKIEECKEEQRQQLMRIEDEHTLLVTQMKQEHDKRQASLIAEHNEQLKRTQLNDHEAQIKALRCELEDECRKLEEELHLQKSKEDRQRALLQLQLKVMSDKPKEDQEVNSKQVDSCFNLFVCVCLQMDAIFANFHVGIPLVVWFDILHLSFGRHSWGNEKTFLVYLNTLSHNRHKKQLRFNDVIYNDGLQPPLKALNNRRKKPFF
ncbi:putative CRM domain-containing protein, chloroplastic [Glycine soja]